MMLQEQLKRSEDKNSSYSEELKKYDHRQEQLVNQLKTTGEVRQLRDKQIKELKKNYEVLEQAVKDVDVFNEVQMKVHQLQNDMMRVGEQSFKAEEGLS